MEIGDLVNCWRVKEIEKNPTTRKTLVTVQCRCGSYFKYRVSTIRNTKMCRRCSNLESSNIKPGQKWGKWLTLLPSPKGKRSLKRPYWDVLCECGTLGRIRSDVLVCGKSKECKNCWYNKHNPELVKSHIWRCILKGAETREIEVSVSKDEIYQKLEDQGYKCALSGVDIGISQKPTEHRKGAISASLDRIDSKLGYHIDNIQWTHKKFNILKMGNDQEEFILLCNMIAKHNPRDV